MTTTPPLRRGWRASAALLVTLSALVACGAPAADLDIAPPPSANPYVASVVITRSWASAIADITYRLEVDGQSTSGSGSGQVALATGRGRLDWSGPDSSGQELLNDRGLFVQDADGTWTKTDEPTRTSGLIDVLAGLGSATPQGSASAAPDGLTRVDVMVPVQADTLRAFPLTTEDRERVLVDPDAEITAITWANANGQIVRIDRRLTATGIGAETTVSLAEFGGMLDLESPTLIAKSTTAPGGEGR